MEQTETNPYQSLNETEKQSIQEKAQGLTNLLGIWASQYPIIRPNRAAPVTVLVATVLPDLPTPLSLLVGKLILFIFAVDDIADERLLSYNDFNRASQAWETIARCGSSDWPQLKDEDLHVVLEEIRNEMSHLPLFSRLCDLWADRLKALCDAMAKEYEYGLRYKAGGKATLPTLEEYIQGGIHSVGFPFWGTSVLVLLDEPGLIERLDTINETIFHTGGAIRLYNDIRTYEKEVREDNINAITIAQKILEENQAGTALPHQFEQAQATVAKLAKAYARKSVELIEKLQIGSGDFQKMVQRIIAFHAYFYGSSQHQRDYHTISSSDSFSMIQGK